MMSTIAPIISISSHSSWAPLREIKVEILDFFSNGDLVPIRLRTADGA
jgi:hypothetical protein